MRTRVISLLLAAVLAAAAVPAPAAFAASPSPAAPGWISPDEYVVFPGSKVYEGEAWKTVLKLRELAAEGKKSPYYPNLKGYKEFIGVFRPAAQANLDNKDNLMYYDCGMAFELALIAYKLFADDWNFADTYLDGQTALTLLENGFISKHPEYLRYAPDRDAIAVLKWCARSGFWGNLWGKDSLDNYLTLIALRDPAFDRREFMKLPEFTDKYALWKGFVNRQAAVKEFQDVHDRITFALDGEYFYDTALSPVSVNGNTMVTPDSIAGALGADFTYNTATGKITVTRALITVEMTVGSKLAYVNGKKYALPVAPYEKYGAWVPLRFLAEALGQTVSYNAKGRVISMEEKAKSKYDVEAWWRGSHAVLAWRNLGNPYLIAGESRNKTVVDNQRGRLASSWSVYDREDLIDTVKSMTNYGHNAEFAEDYAWIKSLSDAEYKKLLSGSGDVDKYMWPLTKSLGDKWGDKQIKAWDWFRMLHIIQWGYVAGYVTKQEAFDLSVPVIERLRSAFKSWKEANENYMDGYAWWSRTDVAKANTEYKRRLKDYDTLLKNFSTVFDETVWK